MTTTRRIWQLAILGIAAILFCQEAIAMPKFGSDAVAAAAKDPVAAAALAARGQLDDAFAAQDIDKVSRLFAKDLIVNTPRNRVGRREQVLGFFREGRMNYESAETTLEALDVRGDHVVLMGEEVVRPRGNAANAGKTVRRRFTDVWRREADGTWLLTIRQATIISVD